MASRLDLHEELCEILGSRNVYYQPPESIKMMYPCIRYRNIEKTILRADDINYKKTNGYELIILDLNPDSTIPDDIIDHFPMCQYDDSYVYDNINHFVLTLFY